MKKMIALFAALCVAATFTMGSAFAQEPAHATHHAKHAKHAKASAHKKAHKKSHKKSAKKHHA
ncbi:MAG: hypothetical protein ACHP65_09765 [Legionellales bacterium]